MSTPYSKKQPCKAFAAGNCTRRNCPFAHVTAGGGNKGPVVIGGGQIFATVLKLLLEKAQMDVYVPDEKRLIISNFRASPDIQSMVNSIDFNTASFCDALCSAIADKLGPTGMSILDVGNNNIRTLTHLANAMKKHGLATNLSALSLADNNISTTDFLTPMQSFPNLQQLVMLGNPVVNNSDYRNMVRKRLPNLVGLDKAPIQRPPLALPWPLQSSGSIKTDGINTALAFIGNYFDVMNGEGGIDSVIDRYHPQAVFSFSYVQEQATIKWEGGGSDNNNNNNNPNNNNGGITSPSRRPPLPSKEVLRDVTALRVKQSEGNHNLTKGLKKENIARGRAEVISKLSHLLYQRCFAVEHIFHNAVNAMMLPQSAVMPIPMIVITLHGYMKWTHRTNQDVQFTRVFDRTMTLVPNTSNPNSNGGVLISNDVIELRINADDPLFFADNGARITMIGRKFGSLDPAIVFACKQIAEAQYGATDAAWFNLLSEIQNGVPMSLIEMVVGQVGTADIPLVINVARLMARRQLNDIPTAVQMLQAAGGNVEAVQ